VFLHDIIERIYFYSIIFSKKEMGSKKHTADVVLHNMIERIYFLSIIFSQKMESEKHTADVVLPAIWQICHTVTSTSDLVADLPPFESSIFTWRNRKLPSPTRINLKEP
jgi:hypothetical protein